MPFYRFTGGWLELIVGPMFSGKSEELIRRVTRALIAKQEVQVFKPRIDNRYDKVAIASHAGRKLEAIAIDEVEDIRKLLKASGHVVAIDEAQFLSADLIELSTELAEEGKRVIVAGLDLDFRAEPFGPIPGLLARAESVQKLTAICARCTQAATRTQRLVNNNPAHYDDPIILVGAFESYEPRCRSCHEVPRHTRRSESRSLFNMPIQGKMEKEVLVDSF
ncbi:MAG: thymidine kinase [Deinococcales bacterium]